MSSAVGTRFYLEKPVDKYWNTGMGKVVIEARPVDIREEGLYDWQKTDSYVRQNLTVITPKNFPWPHVLKRHFIECEGPARQLNIEEYVELYHSLDPARPLPKGWKEHKIRSNL